MSDQTNGGPAFPTGLSDLWGMDLRDYMAAHESLSDIDHPETGGLNAETAAKLAGRPAPRCAGIEYLQWEADWRAAWRYMRADAMLAARSKPKV